MMYRCLLAALLLGSACLPVSLEKDHPLESYANGSHGFPSALVAAGKQVCAYFESPDQSMVCWGMDGDQEGDRIYPQQAGKAAELLEPHSFVSNGLNYCALDSAGRAHCGGLDHAFLGPSFTPDTMHSPSHIQGTETFTRLAMVIQADGTSSACGTPIPEDDSNPDLAKDLYCWGGSVDELFPDHISIQSGYVDLQGVVTGQEDFIRSDFAGIDQVALSAQMGCITDNLRKLWCWGPPAFFGQDGDAPLVGPFHIPTPESREVGRLALKGQNLCINLLPPQGSDEEPTVWCMGENDFGQAGINTSGRQTSLVEVQSLEPGFYELKMGAEHVCARLQDQFNPNQIWCWGQNNKGQLGNGTDKPIFVPSQIDFVNRMPSDSGFEVQQIVVGDDFGCWRATGSGLIHCWGNNEDGQLGQPGLSQSNEPTLVQVHYRFR